MNYTIKDLQNFEQEIADAYKEGKIRAPIHLRGSEDEAYERQMLNIFSIIRPQDYWFSYWDSHIPALLKGATKELVRKEIYRGNSIALCFPEYRFFCSGIVASLCGVACGAALEIKRQGLDEHVYHYCGDMSAETGTFYEAVKYSANRELPITYIVGNNGKSVLSDTFDTWAGKDMHNDYSYKIKEFFYINQWPHSGLSEKVKF